MIARYALLEAGLPFESRRMDIHLAKEQLSPWYAKLNPAMTVPALVEGEQIWTDSQDILNYAATQAGERWMDAEVTRTAKIEQLILAHYSIAIERLTFGKAMKSIPLLRFIIPKILGNVIRGLEKEVSNSANLPAVEAKIELNKQRLSYFSEGNLADKLQVEREIVRNYLSKLPTPQLFLFGDKPSSADILTVVLFGRLKMVGEYSLVQSPDLVKWFLRMQLRSAYKKADIWIYFQPWRIFLKR